MATNLKINGKTHKVDAPAGMPLLWVLRDKLGMTGTKFGCGVGQCGCCTVHADGNPIRSCITPHDQLDGVEISTIEGKESRAAEAIREVWVENDVPQCGYCQAGQIMSATALLENNSNPTDADIDEAMAGNLCRCATYLSIRSAIKEAATKL